MPLATLGVSLEAVGGKGRSLALLAAAGLPVPAGFLITTHAYRKFVATNDLHGPILKWAGRCTGDTAISAGISASEAATEAAREIGSLFRTGRIPGEIEQAIKAAYATFDGAPAVAVRSSATAEDLPNLSFAGQQDSYLNVRGEEALLSAVRGCWASLWSARAIRYRTENQVDHGLVAMGVVVQLMVDAEVAGVLFTANPTSGDRSELLVNSSFGLGEAVVGGRVTPDSYVVDRESLATRKTLTAVKETMIVSAAGQGTRTESVPEARRHETSLSSRTLGDIAGLSLKAEALLGGSPQDVEWAVADGRCWLLQSRPITNLPPEVRWEPPPGAARLVRRQVVENMPDPLSPLFEELYLNEGLDEGLDQLASMMGLPFNLDEFITRPLFLTVNGYGYCRYDIRMSWRMALLIPRMLWWYVRSLPRLLKNLVPLWQDQGLPQYLDTISHWKSLNAEEATDEQLLNGVRALARADAAYWFYITLMVGAAKITEGLLSWLLSSKAAGGGLTSGMFLAGYSSKTLEAQEGLETIAANISSIGSLRALVISRPAGEMLEALANAAESLPANSGSGTILADIERHLDVFGHQVYNLDFVQPTQAEDALPVLLAIRSLVEHPQQGRSNASRQATIVREREALVAQTSASLGGVRRRLFGRFLAWARRYGPYREEALFYMGAAWPTLRRLALRLGKRLVGVGTLGVADDVFFLRSDELAHACEARQQQEACPELREIANERRTLRDTRKRLHPPGRVPEDMRFKFGPFDFTRYFEVWETQKRNVGDATTLLGFAVSPGTVTGIASVVHSPAGFEGMTPGTILVCPTTTPAWTPLFAQASGLVTDIGGILAHGSIVAREYGIPAVLGTGNATARIVSGQLIRVDGNAGTVTIVE
jgi:phosphohistidine swiveling domain-containing protein